MLGLMTAWPESRSFFLYAYNSMDCYTCANPDTKMTHNSALDELGGLWNQIIYITGSDNPEIIGGNNTITCD